MLFYWLYQKTIVGMRLDVCEPVETKYDDRCNQTGLSALSDSRSQGWEKAKLFAQIISRNFQLIWIEFDVLLDEPHIL